MCPACAREFGDGLVTCPDDGAALVTLETGAGERAEALVGKVVDGRYRVERIIGKGGMGTVYACRHIVVGKTFAMKVLRAGVERSEEVLQRFIREAQAANAVRSRHICEMSDFGQLPGRGGAFYVIMELLDGMSLTRALREQRLDLDASCRVFAAVASTLDRAHAQGIIHRDLKPDNVMLVEEDDDPFFVKLVDFGIAKVMQSKAGDLTETGVILGTPYYMSPEQARGERLDPRSDVYALGVMMYRAFTGKLPFVADTAMGVLTRHLTETPERPSRIAHDMDAALERLILRCMEKKPIDRFQSMRDVMVAIESVRERVARPANGPHAHAHALRATTDENPIAAQIRNVEANPTGKRTADVGPPSAHRASPTRVDGAVATTTAEADVRGSRGAAAAAAAPAVTTSTERAPEGPPMPLTLPMAETPRGNGLPWDQHLPPEAGYPVRGEADTNHPGARPPHAATGRVTAATGATSAAAMLPPPAAPPRRRRTTAVPAAGFATTSAPPVVDRPEMVAGDPRITSSGPAAPTSTPDLPAVGVSTSSFEPTLARAVVEPGEAPTDRGLVASLLPPPRPMRRMVQWTALGAAVAVGLGVAIAMVVVAGEDGTAGSTEGTTRLAPAAASPAGKTTAEVTHGPSGDTATAPTTARAAADRVEEPDDRGEKTPARTDDDSAAHRPPALPSGGAATTSRGADDRLPTTPQPSKPPPTTTTRPRVVAPPTVPKAAAEPSPSPATPPDDGVRSPFD
ncbi:MAG: protein kinase [Myxococcota bacterium]